MDELANREAPLESADRSAERRHLVLGMLTVDEILECGTERGLLRRVENRTICVGGKGYLVAAGLATLGASATLIAETSRRVLPEVPPAGVDLSMCPSILEDFDRTWTLLQNGVDDLTLVRLGTRAAEPPDYVELLRGAKPGSLSTYISACPSELLSAASGNIDAGDILVVNCCLPLLQLAGDRDRSPELTMVLSRADVVILNAAEYQILTGVDVLDLRDADSSPLARDAEVVVTLGAQGCLVRRERRWEHLTLPREPKTVKSTLGAGDALAAGFVDEYARSRDATASCVAGMLVAVEKVERFSSHL